MEAFEWFACCTRYASLIDPASLRQSAGRFNVWISGQVRREKVVVELRRFGDHSPIRTHVSADQRWTPILGPVA